LGAALKQRNRRGAIGHAAPADSWQYRAPCYPGDGAPVISLADTDWLWPVALAPFVGSFLGVLATRLPVGGPVVIGRSVCDACGRRLAVLDLIPLVSFLALRGKCRTCGQPIDWLLPAIELAAVAVPLWAMLPEDAPPLWPSALLGWALLVLAAIDMRHFILPDVITLPLIPLGLGIAWLTDPERFMADLYGAVFGFLFLAGLRLAYQRLRGREGLGFGDVKLLAAAGAWVGWDGLPSVLAIAALSGLAVAALQILRGNRLTAASKLAFGPYLCLGLWLVWLYGPLAIG
jgi:leader peptidase (prepilin peptidase)/N-methyltransferase